MAAIKRTATQRWSIRADELTSEYQESKQCHHQPLPEIAGIGHTDVYQLDQDLNYIETRYKPTKNLAILNKTDFQEPRMVVTLTLKGNSCFKSHLGDEVNFNEGFTTITTFNSSMGERLYEADNETTQIRLAFSQKWADKYLDENKSSQLFGQSGIQQLSFRPISSYGINAAKQLLTCDTNKNIKRLFMQGQAMSLLASELQHLFSDNDQIAEKFNLRDMDIARSARDILFREFRNPPSVNDLSKRVGTNQFKLKQLFHHFFKNTPYGLLLEIRMNNAYKLLETTQCQVSVVADFVGYSHASNFSAAFIKYFGVSPKFIAKKN